MKTAVIAGLSVAAFLGAAATAEAAPYLGPGEAARVVGKALNREYNNIAQGSLNARCPASRRTNFRRCEYSYYDDGGTCWVGEMGVKETYARYVYNINYDYVCD